jgi:hypothetical protein
MVRLIPLPFVTGINEGLHLQNSQLSINKNSTKYRWLKVLMKRLNPRKKEINKRNSHGPSGGSCLNIQ